MPRNIYLAVGQVRLASLGFSLLCARSRIYMCDVTLCEFLYYIPLACLR